MNSYQTIIGQRISKIRHEENMTVDDVAIQMRISAKTVHDIEAGRFELKAREIVDLALVLDQAPAALLPNLSQNRQVVGIGPHFDLQQFIACFTMPVCAGLLCSYIEASSADGRDIVWRLIENECGQAPMTMH